MFTLRCLKWRFSCFIDNFFKIGQFFEIKQKNLGEKLKMTAKLSKIIKAGAKEQKKIFRFIFIANNLMWNKIHNCEYFFKNMNTRVNGLQKQRNTYLIK